MNLANLLILAGLTAPAAPDDPRPARPSGVLLRYQPADASGKPAVIATGVGRENLARLSAADWNPEGWPELFGVSVRSGSAPMAGTYRVDGDTVRFEPKFPFELGVRYVATFDPSRLPIPAAGDPARIEFEGPEARRSAPAFVEHMEPSGDVLPENLLKIYLHFSAPMSRGEVYEHVRLTAESGRKIEGAFLEIGEELWDTSGTRITLLLDPGRIKRGLRPHEEEGPILVAGRTYRLIVDREWPDAHGRPMREAFQKTFRAGPFDRTQPDPKTWKIELPHSSSLEPLSVTFPEPFDRAMLDRALVVVRPGGAKAAGRVTVDARSMRWRFTPDRAWTPGAYTLEVDPELEDLAGNSIARAFEVDAERPVEKPEAAQRLRLPITISVGRRP